MASHFSSNQSTKRKKLVSCVQCPATYHLVNELEFSSEATNVEQLSKDFTCDVLISFKNFFLQNLSCQTQGLAYLPVALICQCLSVFVIIKGCSQKQKTKLASFRSVNHGMCLSQNHHDLVYLFILGIWWFNFWAWYTKRGFLQRQHSYNATIAWQLNRKCSFGEPFTP